MKILLLSKYSRLGASSRLRTQQYIPYLSEYNINVTVSPLFDDVYLNNIYNKKKLSKLSLIGLVLSRLFVLLTAKKYDALWIEKELLPYFPPFAEYLLKLFNINYVIDYDDAIFHNYDLSTNSLIKRFLANKIDKVMLYSTVTIAGNHYLANRAHNAGASEVSIIPTVVDITRYPVVNRLQANVLTIGWIGSPSTQKYIVDLHAILMELREKVEFKLMLVGASIDVLDSLPNLDVELITWTEDSEVASINKMDIGIMPLTDGPWEKGKCGYKLIQYMACGLPVVASPVGVNVDIVNTNQCGFLAENDREWSDSLFTLLTEADTRNNFADNGRKAVELTYSLQQQLPKLISIFNSIMK